MPSPSEGRPPSTLLRYVVPLGGLGLAILVALAIRHFGGPGPHISITIVFLVAIMACSWWGGYIPGIVACLIGVLGLPYLFTANFHLSRVDPSRVFFVLLVSVLISRVAHNRNRIEELLRKSNENLDEKVRERTAELQRSNARLRRLNEDLNQFTYSASHDLREPLRMVVIYSQMLHRRYKDRLGSQADEYVQNIVQSAKRMEMLLKDLLAFAHTVNVPIENLHPVDSNEVVAKVLSNLQAAVNESNATVVYKDLPILRIHEAHLLQLFQNLISNAIKFRREEPPRVEISAERRGAQWNIRVSDNGIGIAEKYRDQLFRMFKRLHHFEEYEGTGMGLAICQRIVDRYGCQIWVESEEGCGSTFSFSAPATDKKTT